MSFVIPSLDLLGGEVVRLLHGDFSAVTRYGDPQSVLDSLEVPDGSRLHIVDLEGSRSGRPVETSMVRRLAARNLRVQVGGGIRTIDDARIWIASGAARVVVGTVAAESPEILQEMVRDLGAKRIIPSIDVRDGIVRVAGWQRDAAITPAALFNRLEALGIEEALVTDISKDGAMRGPSFALYRSLRQLTSIRLIASGGVSTLSDVVSLSRLPNLSGCVIGRALLDRTINLAEAQARAATPNAIPERVIPCLDVRDGRVVKGVNFVDIRDAGDPVECAIRYEREGADELVILDISATDANRSTSLEIVRRVSQSLFIPLTVGGGVRTVDDFRALLRAGADRVAINTAAIQDPDLIRRCSEEFGVQAVVLSCDARRVPAESDSFLSSPRIPAAREKIAQHGYESAAPFPSRSLAPLQRGEGPRSGGEGLSLDLHDAPHPPSAPSPHCGGEKDLDELASLRNPVILSREDGEGSQATKPAIEAKKETPQFEAMIRGGKVSSGLDAVAWCRRAEELGAGEILLTSVDRDGTQRGFDLDLLRAVTSTLRIGVIASGGAGAVEHFRDAIETGGARAVLAASLFHDRRLTISALKDYLAAEGIPVRAGKEP